MPKKKSFVVEDALNAAIALFAERGYHDVTMVDLAHCLRLSRSTIYGTFGDKSTLFARALQHCVAEGRATGVCQPDQSLLIIVALESLSSAPAVAQALREMVLDMERYFREAVEQGRADGEIACSVDPLQAAGALLGLYLGFCVLLRAGAREPVLQDVFQQIQTLLPGTS